jgi:hypothetical protein
MPLPKPQQTVRDRNFQSTSQTPAREVPRSNPQTVNTLTGSHSVVSLSQASIDLANTFLEDLKISKGEKIGLEFIDVLRIGIQFKDTPADKAWENTQISDLLNKPKFSQIKTWVHNKMYLPKLVELNQAIIYVLAANITSDKAQVDNAAKAFFKGTYKLLTTSSSISSLSSIPTEVFRMSSP